MILRIKKGRHILEEDKAIAEIIIQAHYQMSMIAKSSEHFLVCEDTSTLRIPEGFRLDIGTFAHGNQTLGYEYFDPEVSNDITKVFLGKMGR